MRHLALCCEYDGSCFHGWQEQENASSVQGSLRSAWEELTGENLHFRGSSRTDAGVSARAHVSDFFTETRIPTDKIAIALNTKLPEGVTAVKAVEVPEVFDARRLPLGKLYVYRYWTGATRPSIGRQHMAFFPKAPQLESMLELAAKLEGEHDFEAMMDQGSVVRVTLRKIHRIALLQRGHRLSLFCLGDGFLYHQVRILAGTLYRNGIGKLSSEQVMQAMRDKNRPALGPTFPPEGLCLERVFYPQEVFGEDGEEDYRYLIDYPEALTKFEYLI